MTRRTSTIAVVIAAASALLVSGCSSGDSGPEKIDGAGQGSPNPTTSSLPSPNTQRPKIRVPKSFSLQFGDWISSDPVKQQVLDDGKEKIRASYAAIIDKELDADYLKFYDTKSGFSQDRKWMKTYTGKNLTVIGNLRLFDAKVTLPDKGGTRALLSYCTDESKARTKNHDTGRVAGNPSGADPHVYYESTKRKDSRGVWQTVSVHSERGGCS